MELLQLFDENKNMVDEYVERKKQLDILSNRRIKIILLFIQNDEGKYLIQKTSKEKGSIFATTGGLVSYGEDDDITVFREAKEELGLDLDKDKLIKIGYTDHPKAFIAVYYYHDNIDIKNLVLQKEEVDYVCWFSDIEIDDLIKKEEFRKGNLVPLEFLKNWLKEKRDD